MTKTKVKVPRARSAFATPLPLSAHALLCKRLLRFLAGSPRHRAGTSIPSPKSQARASRSYGGSSRYSEGRSRWEHLQLKWQLQQLGSKLRMHFQAEATSKSRKHTPSPQAQRSSTPQSGFGDAQVVDLLGSPSAEKLTRQANKLVNFKEPRMKIWGKLPASLTQPYDEKSVIHIFRAQKDTTKAGHDRHHKQAAVYIIPYTSLTSSSIVLRDLLIFKRSSQLPSHSQLFDPSDAIVYDPSVTLERKPKLYDTAIYMKGLLESEYGRGLDGYEEVRRLKLQAFWAGVRTFVVWVRTGDVVFGRGKGDQEAAVAVALYLGACEEHFLALDL